MKRFVMSGLMVALIAVGVAMGCGGGETEPTPTPEATPEITPTPTEEIGELPGTFQYSMEWSDSTGSMSSMEVWVKGEKSRVDLSTTDPGEETETIIFIDDGEFNWMYYPDENLAYKWPTMSGVNPGAAYALWFTENYYGTVSEAMILTTMEVACSFSPTCSSVSITGHETISGQSCTKFTLTAEDGGTATYWISNSGWLMKVETIDATGYTVTMEFASVDLNPSISNDIFDIYQVAPDAVIIDMTEW